MYHNEEPYGDRGAGNEPDAERFGTGKPQEITDDRRFASLARAAIAKAIKAVTGRPLGQKPQEGGR